MSATRRNITFPDDLWERIVKAAAQEQAHTGIRVPTAEWIRTACEERLAREQKRSK